MMTTEELRGHIDRYRKLHYVTTYRELARRLGIPQATLSRWITGRVRISKVYVRWLQLAGVLPPPEAQ